MWTMNSVRTQEKTIHLSHSGMSGMQGRAGRDQVRPSTVRLCGKIRGPFGFATRVMARIEENEKRAPFWGFFTLQPFFLRAVEVAFALVVIIIGMVSGNLLVAGQNPGKASQPCKNHFLSISSRPRLPIQSEASM